MSKHSLNVSAKTYDDAVERFRVKHPEVEITGAVKNGLFLAPDLEVTWVRTDGGVQRLRTISLSNLRAIRERLLAGGETIKQTGYFKEVEAAIAEKRNQS